MVGELLKKDQWIVDGNYKSTFDLRMPVADTIIFLDYSRWLSLLRAFKRYWQHRNSKRSDMPDEWRERLHWDFFKFIWSYNQVERPKVRLLLHKYQHDKAIIVFSSPREAENFLNNFE